MLYLQAGVGGPQSQTRTRYCLSCHVRGVVPVPSPHALTHSLRGPVSVAPWYHGVQTAAEFAEGVGERLAVANLQSPEFDIGSAVDSTLRDVANDLKLFISNEQVCVR